MVRLCPRVLINQNWWTRSHRGEHHHHRRHCHCRRVAPHIIIVVVFGLRVRSERLHDMIRLARPPYWHSLSSPSSSSVTLIQLRLVQNQPCLCNAYASSCHARPKSLGFSKRLLAIHPTRVPSRYDNAMGEVWCDTS